MQPWLRRARALSTGPAGSQAVAEVLGPQTPEGRLALIVGEAMVPCTSSTCGTARPTPTGSRPSG
jgi:hypothetical protein